MIIDYVSDVHIDHYVRYQENTSKWEENTRIFASFLIKGGNGDVLVVAGDISENNAQMFWFLDEVAKYYNKVFFVLGNHDCYLTSKTNQKKYSYNFKNKIEDLKIMIQGNQKISLLDKDVIIYKGKTFAGDVLWYYPKDIKDQMFYLNIMPDSDFIFTKEKEDKLLMMEELNADSIKWFDSLKNKQIDVLVTHVPPVNNPMSPFEDNECFATVVNHLPSKHWICGHQHTRHDFELNDSNIYMNPLGYPNENGEFVLQSFEI